MKWNALIAVGLSFLNIVGCTRVSTQTGTQVRAGNPWTIHGVLRIGDTRVPDNLNRMLGTLTVDTELSAFWCAHLFNWNTAKFWSLSSPSLSLH